MSKLDLWEDRGAFANLVRDYEAAAVRELAHVLAWREVLELRQEAGAELAAAQAQLAEAEGRLPALTEKLDKLTAEAGKAMEARNRAGASERLAPDHPAEKKLRDLGPGLATARHQHDQANRQAIMAGQAVKRLSVIVDNLGQVEEPHSPLLEAVGILGGADADRKRNSHRRS